MNTRRYLEVFLLSIKKSHSLGDEGSNCEVLIAVELAKCGDNLRFVESHVDEIIDVLLGERTAGQIISRGLHSLRHFSFCQESRGRSSRANNQLIGLQIDAALVALQEIQAQQDIHRLIFQDRKAGRDEDRFDAHINDVNFPDDFLGANSLSDPTPTSIDQVGNVAFFGGLEAHDRLLGTGIHERFERGPIHFAINVEHGYTGEDFWGVFYGVLHVSLDVFLLDLFFDHALGFWVEGVGGQHSLVVVGALVVLVSGGLDEF
jgi:hypothetical protein